MGSDTVLDGSGRVLGVIAQSAAPYVIAPSTLHDRILAPYLITPSTLSGPTKHSLFRFDMDPAFQLLALPAA